MNDADKLVERLRDAERFIRAILGNYSVERHDIRDRANACKEAADALAQSQERTTEPAAAPNDLELPEPTVLYTIGQTDCISKADYDSLLSLARKLKERLAITRKESDVYQSILIECRTVRDQYLKRAEQAERKLAEAERDAKGLLIALKDLLAQIDKETARNGEGDFYTGEARAAIDAARKEGKG